MILQVKGLSKHFHGLAAVNRVDMHVEAGEILAIIGPNGAGKTTLFNCITNTLPPTRGSVLWKGHDIAGKGPHVAAQKGIIRSFQHASLFLGLTVEENVLIGGHRRYRNGFWKTIAGTRSAKTEEKEMEADAVGVLTRYELIDKRDRSAKSLSFGEMRRLQVAICMAGQPELLLLDEPAGGLNPEETRQLMDIIRTIQAQGITVCLVEHDMKFVMGLCSRVIVLDAGRKIAEGTPAEIQSNERVIEVYLGGKQFA
jgi:branched-chain amino acid transport system ATP-binding protein